MQLLSKNHSVFNDDYEKLKEQVKLNNSKSVFLFGYGSLLWKADFDYNSKIFGYVKNFKRLFWLLSDDHRGTPESPGRVATLVNSNGDEDSDRVYGLAYEITVDNMEKTFAYLNFREKCGYSMKTVKFNMINSEDSFDCVCYFANEDNIYYSPEPDTHSIARQICVTVGPSGSNKEYLYNLCLALRQLAYNNNNNHMNNTNNNEDILNECNNHPILKYDHHLFELEYLVKKLDTNI